MINYLQVWVLKTCRQKSHLDSFIAFIHIVSDFILLVMIILNAKRSRTGHKKEARTRKLPPLVSGLHKSDEKHVAEGITLPLVVHSCQQPATE